MFDARLRPLIDPPLNAMGRALARVGISANAAAIRVHRAKQRVAVALSSAAVGKNEGSDGHSSVGDAKEAP
mgnify:CR=1 FL=1